MASQLIPSVAFIIVIISLCSSFIPSSSATPPSSAPAASPESSSHHHQSPAELINAQCPRSLYPSFCLGALAADNRTATVSSITSLAEIALDLATQNASNAVGRLYRIMWRLDPKNTRLNRIVKACISAYGRVYGSFWSALGEVGWDTMTANYDSLIAADQAEPCGKELAAGGVRNSSLLWKMHKDLLCFSNIGYTLTIDY